MYSNPIEPETDWEELANIGAFGKVVVANFDQDADDELLLLRVDESSLLFEMDGSYTEVALYGLGFLSFSKPWDFNNDGVFEIMPEPGNNIDDVGFFPGYASVTNQLPDGEPPIKEVPVYNLDYSIAGRYPLDKMKNYQASGDFDGDGTPDRLYSNDYPSMDVFAENITGEVIWEFTLPIIRSPFVMFLCAGDFDGDGREEFFNPTEANRVYGMEQEPIDLGNLEYFGFPNCAADVNGDGIEEAISQSGFYDFAANELTLFNFPEGEGSFITDVIFTGDLNDDGIPEIVLAVPYYPSVFILDPQGNCLYFETFADFMPGDFTVAHYQGRDYLVARLMDRIMVYP